MMVAIKALAEKAALLRDKANRAGYDADEHERRAAKYRAEEAALMKGVAECDEAIAAIRRSALYGREVVRK